MPELRKRHMTSAAFLMAAVLIGTARPATAQSPVGVWRMTHWENANGEGPAPLPAYTAYFDNGYYTVIWELGDTPRPDLPENATEAELLAAWQPFTAQFGTYQVNGSDITYTRLVSKTPQNMRPGNQSYVRSFRISGNTLTTFTETATYTYRRVD
jgi:hypothetical protein